MKKMYLLFCAICLCSLLQAQVITSVGAGTSLYITPGTIFSMQGLSLTPSAGFALSGVTVAKTNTVTVPPVNTYIARVYKFSSNTNAFSGTIQFNYLTAELNGLDGATLQVNTSDGTSWQKITSATNNTVNNYVISNTVSNRIFNEITLASSFAPLPLQWGTISAWRLAKTVKISWLTKQELSVHYFTVQKSEDGLTWKTLADTITATNTSLEKRYTVTDNKYTAAVLFYRIKQTGLDGAFSFSTVAAVAADNEINNAIIYPNPVSTVFYIINVAATDIKQVALYNNTGSLLKIWPGAQPAYNMVNFARGIYHVQVQLKNGTAQSINLTK